MIALIGGSGFIGTRLGTRLKAAGTDFKILDILKSDAFEEIWQHADVTDLDSLRKSLQDCTTIINLAAEHKDNVTPRSLYDDVNVKGASNVCRVADELGIKKIIFTSSVAVYGLPKHETDESGDFNYFNDYGRTKLLAEKEYDQWYARGGGRSLLVLRPTVVFGEGNRGNVYNLLRQITSGKFLMIGDGENRKSMVYVENIAALLERLLEEEGYFLSNVVDKPDFTMNELVREVNKIMKNGNSSAKVRLPYWIGYAGGLGFDTLSLITRKKYSVSSVRIKKFCASTQFKSTNIDKLNFIPPVDLKEGLRRTITSEFLSKKAQ